jgi:hypothetical protein
MHLNSTKLTIIALEISSASLLPMITFMPFYHIAFLPNKIRNGFFLALSVLLSEGTFLSTTLLRSLLKAIKTNHEN